MCWQEMELGEPTLVRLDDFVCQAKQFGAFEKNISWEAQ